MNRRKFIAGAASAAVVAAGATKLVGGFSLHDDPITAAEVVAKQIDYVAQWHDHAELSWMVEGEFTIERLRRVKEILSAHSVPDWIELT